jgi:hypothetical protein
MEHPRLRQAEQCFQWEKGSFLNMRSKSILTIMALSAVLALAATAYAGNNLVVGTCKGATHSTIQAAVDDAAVMPGKQVISICPGTFAENVTIGPDTDETADLEIKGAGLGKTVVTGEIGGTTGPIFDVDSAGTVKISDLTVDGQSAMATSYDTVYGIRYTATSGQIKNVEVLNIRDAAGTSYGMGIMIQNAPSNVKIEKCVVENFTRRGIYINNGAWAEVRDNDVAGPLLPLDPYVVPNGIQISRGAGGVAKGNYVQLARLPNPPTGAVGTGILVFCAQPTKVDHNYVTDSDQGIVAADNQGATIWANEIHNSYSYGISLQFLGRLTFGTYLGCPADPNPSPTTGNLVKDNKVFDSAKDSITFEQPAPEPTWLPENDAFVDNTFMNNKVTGSGFDGFIILWGHDNLFTNNTITNGAGSPYFDIEDATMGPGTAGTANEWLKNKCTSSSPADICQ